MSSASSSTRTGNWPSICTSTACGKPALPAATSRCVRAGRHAKAGRFQGASAQCRWSSAGAFESSGPFVGSDFAGRDGGERRALGPLRQPSARSRPTGQRRQSPTAHRIRRGAQERCPLPPAAGMLFLLHAAARNCRCLRQQRQLAVFPFGRDRRKESAAIFERLRGELLSARGPEMGEGPSRARQRGLDAHGLADGGEPRREGLPIKHLASITAGSETSARGGPIEHGRPRTPRFTSSQLESRLPGSTSPTTRQGLPWPQKPGAAKAATKWRRCASASI